MPPDYQDIETAGGRLKGVIQPSPLVRSGHFCRMLHREVFLKLENLQETGAFKVRGAYNRLSRLSRDERRRGVIAASAGNHAQGVAWASARLGITPTLVMPEDVSIRKLLSVREYGAEVILSGAHYNEACDHAESLCRAGDKIFIPAFDDPDVVAGQGTIALELTEVMDRDTAVVVPVGGGGLISGIAVAAKALCPGVRIIGVQSANCPSTLRSLEEETPFTVPMAALLDGQVSPRAKKVIVIVSGGNIELNTIDRILERGAIRLGRLVRLEVNILDVPGALHRLLGLIAREKANILHIFHDRLDLKNPIEVSRVVLNLETRGHDHARDLVDRLRKAGYAVKPI